jgi:nucleoid-associated protein YgaU
MFPRALVVLLAVALLVGYLARPSGGAGPETRYVVKPYDTLWSIAQRHYAGDPRAAVWRIEKANHLPGADVSVGQRLVLP